MIKEEETFTCKSKACTYKSLLHKQVLCVSGLVSEIISCENKLTKSMWRSMAVFCFGKEWHTDEFHGLDSSLKHLETNAWQS